MNYEQLKRNMKLIFSEGDMERIAMKETDTGLICIDIDVHGMKCKRAQRFIKNIINLSRGDVLLEIVHGFNNGTKIKKMIWETRWTSRDTECACPPWNPGLTKMKVAA